jgi:Na+-driven multidrug efflux pump
LLLRIYVASTGRVIPIFIVHIIGNIFNFISHYICIYQLNLGIRAAPISITIAYTAIVLCYVVYIRFSSLYADTWHPITRACLQEWNIYLQYALPGVVVMM